MEHRNFHNHLVWGRAFHVRGGFSYKFEDKSPQQALKNQRKTTSAPVFRIALGQRRFEVMTCVRQNSDEQNRKSLNSKIDEAWNQQQRGTQRLSNTATKSKRHCRLQC